MFIPQTKVLVVDDARSMRRVIAKILGDMGFTNIHEADDGATAWDKMELALQGNDPYKLVISDWNMPVMKGVDLLDRVRKHPALKSTYFILVTAEKEISQVQQAVALGVNGYVTKPFSPQVLKEKLEKVSVAKAG